MPEWKHERTPTYSKIGSKLFSRYVMDLFHVIFTVKIVKVIYLSILWILKYSVRKMFLRRNIRNNSTANGILFIRLSN